MAPSESRFCKDARLAGIYYNFSMEIKKNTSIIIVTTHEFTRARARLVRVRRLGTGLGTVRVCSGYETKQGLPKLAYTLSCVTRAKCPG